jgi:CNT family concentrative nucleoside transporter
MNRFLLGPIGMAILILVAVLLSSNRRAIRLRVVGAAFALQVSIAVLVLYVPAGRRVIRGLSEGVGALLGYAQAGTDFIFGPIA